jgi:hypothetical protein
MSKHILFINTQAFGDVIFGINAAKRYKMAHPDDYVSYALKSNFSLTTNETPQGLQEVLEVLALQPWLDSVGVVEVSSTGQITSLKLNKQSDRTTNVDKIFVQNNWFSDLGISQSASLVIKEHLPPNLFDDVQPQLYLGTEKTKTNKIKIATAGPLDWNRKLQNESLRVNTLYGIKERLEKDNIEFEINMLGVDIGNLTLLQSLQFLQQHDVFIGPMGSLVHAAAALGLDTICVPSVFPSSYDSPSSYASIGNHYVVEHNPANHCKTYACITEKRSDNADTRHAFGNPPASLGFWPKYCPHTSTGMSCTNQVQYEDILSKFEEWLNERNN